MARRLFAGVYHGNPGDPSHIRSDRQPHAPMETVDERNLRQRVLQLRQRKGRIVMPPRHVIAVKIGHNKQVRPGWTDRFHSPHRDECAGRFAQMPTRAFYARGKLPGPSHTSPHRHRELMPHLQFNGRVAPQETCRNFVGVHCGGMPIDIPQIDVLFRV